MVFSSARRGREAKCLAGWGGGAISGERQKAPPPHRAWLRGMPMGVRCPDGGQTREAPRGDSARSPSRDRIRGWRRENTRHGPQVPARIPCRFDNLLLGPEAFTKKAECRSLDVFRIVQRPGDAAPSGFARPLKRLVCKPRLQLGQNSARLHCTTRAFGDRDDPSASARQCEARCQAIPHEMHDPHDSLPVVQPQRVNACALDGAAPRGGKSSRVNGHAKSP